MRTSDVLALLRRHWFFIVTVSLLGAAVGIGWAATRPAEYTARADVLVTVTSGQSTGELAQGSSFSQQQARNFAAVATREVVLAPVIAELSLDTTVEGLRRNLTVTVPLNTSLISIQATDLRPATAAAIANATARELASAVAELSPTVSDLRGPPVRASLIERAVVPDEPSAPDFRLLALIGLLAGLVVGVAYQVISELLVGRISSPQQAERATRAVVIGSVTRDRRAGQLPIAVTAAPLSHRAEEIRQVRTALKFLPGGDHHVYVFSSSVSGEGKSTTAANLAAAFAAEDLSTCLVEADLRKPSLGRTLDLTGGPGLSDVIVGESTLQEAVQEWGPHGLHVLLAGRIPPNPSELLGSKRGMATLEELREKYDVVIIDTPPLVSVTDARIVARQFGGLVLVTGAGRVRTGELRHAVSALAIADLPILGVILNMAKSGESPSYAYVESGQPGSLTTRLRGLVPTLRQWKLAAKLATVTALTVAIGTTGALAAARPAPLPDEETVARRPRAVFIGDSLVQGAGGEGVTWTALVAKRKGWTEINLGLGGTGYVKTAGRSGCGLDHCPAFPDMVPAAVAEQPDIVIISGGQNDGTLDVSEASERLFTSLREYLPQARIIVLSPLWRASKYPDSLRRMGNVLKHNADITGVEWIDVGNPLEGQPDLFTSDKVHPTAAGYRILAETIARKL